jgi:hypothetical protein
MMSPTNSRTIDFAAMPDTARLWIVASPAELTPAIAGNLLERVDAFLEEWNAHGQPVVGARDLRYDRFLMIAADEAATGVSGCSGDALFRVFKGAESDLGISLLDSSRVWFRTANGIQTDTRAGFRERVKKGEVDAETIVFDNTAATVGDVRAGRWERPVRESWHRRLQELEARS